MLIVKQRQQRYLLVIRCILITVGVFIAIGTPPIVLLLIFCITGEEQPLFYRILWFFINLSMMVLSLSIVICTPQLRSIVMKKFQHNRVAPLGVTLAGSAPVGYNTIIL